MEPFERKISKNVKKRNVYFFLLFCRIFRLNSPFYNIFNENNYPTLFLLKILIKYNYFSFVKEKNVKII